MKRYRKITTDRPPISDEEVNLLKPSFDDLLETTKVQDITLKKSPVRYILLTAITAAVIIIAVLGYAVFFRNDKPSGPDTDTPLQLAEPFDKPGIRPPDPGKIKYEYFVVKNGGEAVFSSDKGSKITVPDAAFTFRNGKPCTGEVVVKYSEFHNPLEIFLSGVPMGYDSAGVNYTFESAGMFDIQAFSGGESLTLAQNKEIRVDLVSPTQEPFNIYYFDTVANRWNYIATETAKDIVAVKSDEPMVAEAGSDEQNLLAVAPDAPESDTLTSPEKIFKKRDKKNFAFKIDFEERRFPELAGMKNLLFEVRDAMVNTQYLRGTWDSIALAGSGDDGYEISLFRLKKSYTFEAQPVLDASDYEAVMEKFNNAMAARAAESISRKKRVESQREIVKEKSNQVLEWAGIRRLSVVNLGIWNCDRPIPMPEDPLPFFAGFTDERGYPVAPASVFVAQKNTNILWTYRSKDQWYISKSKQNILWFIMPDGRYGILTDEQLRDPAHMKTPLIATSEEAIKLINRHI